MKPIKLKDGTMKVDLYTASAIVQVLDKINPANKAKLTKMLNGKKSDFMRAADGIMKSRLLATGGSDMDEEKHAEEERMLDIAEQCFMRIADLLHII